MHHPTNDCWKRVGKATEREDVKKALDRYYEVADGLAKSQNAAIEAIEALGKTLTTRTPS